jgi:hypothetical protein
MTLSFILEIIQLTSNNSYNNPSNPEVELGGET